MHSITPDIALHARKPTLRSFSLAPPVKGRDEIYCWKTWLIIADYRYRNVTDTQTAIFIISISLGILTKSEVQYVATFQTVHDVLHL